MCLFLFGRISDSREADFRFLLLVVDIHEVHILVSLDKRSFSFDPWADFNSRHLRRLSHFLHLVAILTRHYVWHLPLEHLRCCIHELLMVVMILVSFNILDGVLLLGES